MTYKASPTMCKFHLDEENFVRLLMGPFGSGKSVACAMEVLRLCMAQHKGPDGVRRSRWAVVRNSYRELQDTTINTWSDWIPEQLGYWKLTDMKFTLKFNDIEAEILFRALDKPQDIKKLLSLELTGAWLNESREIPKAIFEAVQGRVGRYPAKRDGGPRWYGIIADTNPPDEDHYIYRVFEEEQPEGYICYRQPSGLSPDAENRENLPDGYYERMIIGKDPEWIKVYVHGEYGFVQNGKCIYPEFNERIHVCEEDDEYLFNPDRTLFVGIDFGLTPAAVFAQKTTAGGFRILDELVTEDMGASRFAKELRRKLGRDFHDATDIEVWADPAGMQRAQTDETTPFDILNAHGIPAMPTYTNDFVVRRDAVGNTMLALDFSGEPAFRMNRSCRVLRKACAGGYKYRRMMVVGDERYQDKPDKNMYSHVAEALQYLLVGAGEDRGVLASLNPHTPKVIRMLGASR